MTNKLIFISYGALILYAMLFGKEIGQNNITMVLFLASAITYVGSSNIYLAISNEKK